MSWQQQYLAYDQDSLATYANAGLVRRALKDIEAEKVILQNEQAEQITIESDGQQVCLSATGLVNASCTCPATGACKHIVAAVLYLQQHLQNPAQQQIENQTQDTPELVEISVVSFSEQPQVSLNKPNLIEEILVFDLNQLAKKIGKAQTQKAIKLARLWQQEQQTELLEEQYRLKIQIKSLAEDIIYVAGAGFAGMLSNLEKDQSAYYLAALSEVQRLQGKSWAELELSEAENPAILSESERQFIVELKDDLAQLLEFGLSHVNEMTARQLHLLNMSARSESLPRLAAMLRQLSGQVNRLLNRDEHSSEQDTLLYLAQMNAYLYQLQHVQGEQLLKLRGKLRQQYQLDEVAKVLRFAPLTRLRALILPGAAPGIFAGLRLALIYAWLGNIGAEYFMSSGTGIGSLMINAQQLLDMPTILCGMVLIGITGAALDKAGRLLESCVTRWRQQEQR